MKWHDKRRRLFLQALAACLVAPADQLLAANSYQPSVSTLDGFLKAASGLTGIKLSNRALARNYLSVLHARFGPNGIETLIAAAASGTQALSAAARKPPLKEIAQQAILLWLTGVAKDPATGELQVVAYTEAAVWEALPFTKPPGQCGGAFGYWSQAPSAI